MIEKQNNDINNLHNAITSEEKHFMDSLAERESSGDYKKVNKFGYLGRYQFGEVALEELGYYFRTKRRWGPKNHWEGKWTGKHNINSKEDFLNNPKVQDIAVKELFIRNWKYIRMIGLHKYLGTKIDGIDITTSGLIAGMHLVGLKGVSRFLMRKNHVTDGLGTNVKEYINKFKGYKLAFTIPNRHPA